MPGEDEDTVTSAVEAALIKIGGRLIYSVYGLLLVAIVAAFGGGVWVTQINSQIGEVGRELVRVREAIGEMKSNIPPKWLMHELENFRGVHEMSREEQRRLQRQIDRLERKVWPSGAIPPLEPYAH